MQKVQHLLYLVALILGTIGCQEQKSTSTTTKTPAVVPTLKSAYQEHFTIGAALGATHITQENPVAAALIEREFNTITPENIMKWMYIHPTPDSFAFQLPDQFVALGKDNEMFVVGHALVWHSQLAEWVEQISDKVELENHVKNHINTIVKKYKGRIDAWDVVNEALNEDGSLRESIFLKTLGADYIANAFALAAAADPSAELYYNDYNLWKPEKRAGVVRLVKELQAKGIKIDGVGMQAHYSINGPSLEEIENSIIAFSNLGIKVMFTELDLTVLPNPWDLDGADVNQDFENSPEMNPYTAGLPDSAQIQLALQYETLFKLFLKHEDKISRVTFWGVNDGGSWLNNWPIEKRTNYPLLFDRDFKPKKAYQTVLDLKK